MKKYCGNCGTEMAQDEKFCAICGTKFESSVITTTDTPKKKLTKVVYVLDCPCKEKKFVEGDDNPDEWRLWFENMTRELNVAVSVKQEFYDATEIEEEFFVVFLQKDKVPCLCYRKSEWTK